MTGGGIPSDKRFTESFNSICREGLKRLDAFDLDAFSRNLQKEVDNI